MKALTVRQPWASLIMAGVKDIENRTWRTKHRGKLTIHAGRADRGPHTREAWHAVAALNLDTPTGVLLGTVDLFDITENSASAWAVPEHYHWQLRNPKRMRPVAAKGRLGLWQVER